METWIQGFLQSKAISIVSHPCISRRSMWVILHFQQPEVVYQNGSGELKQCQEPWYLRSNLFWMTIWLLQLHEPANPEPCIKLAKWLACRVRMPRMQIRSKRPTGQAFAKKPIKRQNCTNHGRERQRERERLPRHNAFMARKACEDMDMDRDGKDL